SHPDGLHDDFETYPFAPSSNIWIGYLDQPTKAYRHFISLDDLVDKAQENHENGYKSRFPLYVATFDGRDGRYVPLNEDLMFSTQCSACKDKKDCDRVLMQYFPIKVWNYARKRPVNIFIKGQTMLALLRHKSHGKYGFQQTSGEVSKTMTVEFAEPRSNSVDERDASTDEALNHDKASSPNTNISNYFAKPLNCTSVIDLTLDEEDEQPIEPELRNTLQNHEVISAATLQSEHHPSQLASNTPTDLMKQFGGMMASIVAGFGIDALDQPEARRLKVCMGQAAKTGNKTLLCHYFGALNAVLLVGK
ncbi:unnamed protein product, partial [Aureobasidium vineae]